MSDLPAMPPDVIELRHVLRLNGRQSVSGMLTYLRPVLKHEMWRGYVEPRGTEVRFSTFGEWCDHNTELTPEAVISMLEHEGYGDDANAVRKAQLQSVPTMAGHGSNQHDRGQGITRSSHDVADGKLARLKRDRPDLAQRVVDGDMSANAAAIEAGFRRPYLNVRADDLHAALAKVSEHYGQPCVTA